MRFISSAFTRKHLFLSASFWGQILFKPDSFFMKKITLPEHITREVLMTVYFLLWPSHSSPIKIKSSGSSDAVNRREKQLVRAVFTPECASPPLTPKRMETCLLLTRISVVEMKTSSPIDWGQRLYLSGLQLLPHSGNLINICWANERMRMKKRREVRKGGRWG